MKMGNHVGFPFFIAKYIQTISNDSDRNTTPFDPGDPERR